jgi:hypothetical protein
MHDEWDALEHYLRARTTPAPIGAGAEPAVTPVVVTIPARDPDDAPAPPVAALGAGPSTG